MEQSSLRLSQVLLLVQGVQHRYYLLERKVYSEAKSNKDSATVPPNTNLESFQLGREGSVIPNAWLLEDALPGFKKACLAFYWVCYSLGVDYGRLITLRM